MPTRTHPTQTHKRLQMSTSAKKQAAFYAPPAKYIGPSQFVLTIPDDWKNEGPAIKMKG